MNSVFCSSPTTVRRKCRRKAQSACFGLGLVVALALTFILVSVLIPMPASAKTQSVRLTDAVGEDGGGSVQLLKDTTASNLEAMRSEHGGCLVFGVDINESIHGLETAKSQGVAIKTLKLKVKFKNKDSKEYEYKAGEDRSSVTNTKSKLEDESESGGSEKYTLLGESASIRKGAANTFQAEFDDTFRLKVGDSLATATSAELEIEFVRVRTSGDDGEQKYYDYSGDVESLALLNTDDESYIETYAAGEQEAPAVIPVQDPLLVATWTYFPSANSYYMAGYEDLYPARGDYDFNDLTVAYQVAQGLNAKGEVVAIRGTAYLVTRGAAYSHNWRLKLDLPAGVAADLLCTYQRSPTDTEVKPCSDSNLARTQGGVDILVFEKTATIFTDPGSTFVNTEAGRPFVPGPKAQFALNLTAPMAAGSMPKAPFNPYLHVIKTGQMIQLMEVNPAFRDANGFPFGMLMPTGWQPPTEKTALIEGYDTFVDFVASRGAQATGWYRSPRPTKVKGLPANSVWAW